MTDVARRWRCAASPNWERANAPVPLLDAGSFRELLDPSPACSHPGWNDRASCPRPTMG